MHAVVDAKVEAECSAALSQPRRIVQSETPVTVPPGHMKEATSTSKRVPPAPAAEGVRQLIRRFAIALPASARRSRMRSRVTCVLPCVLTGGSIDVFWPLAMIAVCLSFVALNEAEQVRYPWSWRWARVRSGSYRRKEVIGWAAVPLAPTGRCV
jgi:hypothetical protein